MFERFLPRLIAREYEGAFAEARAAFFLHRNGFKVLRWEPEAVPGRPGDFEIQWRQTDPIFIEVKWPGWEGELSGAERKAGRQHQPKHRHLEGRSLDPIRPVLGAINRSLPKLDPNRPNLVIVIDDLFTSPTDLPPDWLDHRIGIHLHTVACGAVGGVLLLNPVVYVGEPLEYVKYFVPNPRARVALPSAVIAGLQAGNNDRQGPPWRPR